MRNPNVSVMITGFVGAYGDQIRVVGQAGKPQSLPYRANMTLLDVMIAVGGLAEFAAGNRAVIVRQEDDKQLRIPVRLQRPAGRRRHRRECADAAGRRADHPRKPVLTRMADASFAFC